MLAILIPWRSDRLSFMQCPTIKPPENDSSTFRHASTTWHVLSPVKQCSRSSRVEMLLEFSPVVKAIPRMEQEQTKNHIDHDGKRNCKHDRRSERTHREDEGWPDVPFCRPRVRDSGDTATKRGNDNAKVAAGRLSSAAPTERGGRVWEAWDGVCRTVREAWATGVGRRSLHDTERSE